MPQTRPYLPQNPVFSLDKNEPGAEPEYTTVLRVRGADLTKRPLALHGRASGKRSTGFGGMAERDFPVLDVSKLGALRWKFNLGLARAVATSTRE